MAEEDRNATLVDRLQGVYRIPVTDGLGQVPGSAEPDNPGEYVHRFETPPIQREAAVEIERLRAEVADLRVSVVAFCSIHAVEHAKAHGLPKNHIFARHWDILERAGARMDDFKRWEGSAPGRGA